VNLSKKSRTMFLFCIRESDIGRRYHMSRANDTFDAVPLGP
jgi:hypothetical protein